ncbi:transcription factor E2F3 [Nematocida sp. LUAm3]|nr:transcription factor E2F3 [Nematocida sp. LUAm3]KAI5173684.1 transcription factor E2F3 [Nematocida sp. LUAm2]KAI5176905.1 transcription factor E2F3 [Nematocida sp. LUAm1]
MHDSPTSSLFTFLSDIDYSEQRSTLTSRMESSLGVITKKFLRLLKNSPNKEIDLNYAANVLEIHKRRLYDITNVLEGIGYIKKKIKNSVEYIGHDHSKKCHLCGGTMKIGCKDIKDAENLLMQENELNKEITQVNNELHLLASQEETVNLAYITYSDLKNICDLSSLSLFAVKTPAGTILDFPSSEENAYTVSFSSDCGKIEVFYLQDSSENT